MYKNCPSPRSIGCWKVIIFSGKVHLFTPTQLVVKIHSFPPFILNWTSKNNLTIQLVCLKKSYLKAPFFETCPIWLFFVVFFPNPFPTLRPVAWSSKLRSQKLPVTFSSSSGLRKMDINWRTRQGEPRQPNTYCWWQPETPQETQQLRDR